MLCCQWSRFDTGLPPRVVRAALAVSGIFELEPLRHAPFLAADLKLSARGACAQPGAHAGTLSRPFGGGGRR